MLNANLTAEEEFRLTGTLSPAKIEELLDTSAEVGYIKGIDAHIEEAMGQFPAEDFLSDTISRLHEFARRLRGQNRSDLLGIIESIDDLAQLTFNAADYGRDELKKALAAIVE